VTEVYLAVLASILRATTKKGRQLFGGRKVYLVLCNLLCSHRRRQDVLWRCTFLQRKKLTAFFSRRPQNTRWNYLNNLSHRPDLPNFLEKLDSCSALGGCTLCLGVHLQLCPVNLAQIFFSALGVNVLPVHPLATPTYAVLFLWIGSPFVLCSVLSIIVIKHIITRVQLLSQPFNLFRPLCTQPS